MPSLRHLLSWPSAAKKRLSTMELLLNEGILLVPDICTVEGNDAEGTAYRAIHPPSATLCARIDWEPGLWRRLCCGDIGRAGARPECRWCARSLAGHVISTFFKNMEFCTYQWHERSSRRFISCRSKPWQHRRDATAGVPARIGRRLFRGRRSANSRCERGGVERLGRGGGTRNGRPDRHRYFDH